MKHSPFHALALAAVLVSLLSGCEKPFDRTPPGFVDACHGGIANSAQNWVCSERRQIVSLEGTADDWPRLHRILKEFGAHEELKVFGGIERQPGHIEILDLQLCSAEGLYLSVDDRAYDDDRFNNELETIAVVLRTYRDDFKWKPVAERLFAKLETEWIGGVSVDYPAPLGKSGQNRALPDSIKSCEARDNEFPSPNNSLQRTH